MSVQDFERHQNSVSVLVLDYEKGQNSAQGFERHQNLVSRLVGYLESKMVGSKAAEMAELWVAYLVAL